MTSLKHRTIPVFIPELACPFRCIYCNQHVISGQQQMPSDHEILSTIESHLATFPADAHVELGFFGGTFTGLDLQEQKRLLKLVSTYVKSGSVSSIRLSTRPDYMSEEIIETLVEGGVKTVELGVQSMDQDVLNNVHRGYGVEKVLEAAALIRQAGLELGMQMMVGLPGDSPEKCLSTAMAIVDAGAKNTRIYPTLVVRQTALAAMYERGLYHPLTIEEAVEWTAPVLRHFEENNVTVLRVGLHPTEGFINGTDYLAGPFHVSFKELVMTEIFNRQFGEWISTQSLQKDKELLVQVNPSKVNAAIGYHTRNRSMLRQYFREVRFEGNPTLKNYQFIPTLLG